MLDDVGPAAADDRPAVATKGRVAKRVALARGSRVVVGAIRFNDQAGLGPVAVDLVPVVASVHEAVDQRWRQAVVDAEVEEACLRLGSSPQDLLIESSEDRSQPGHPSAPTVASNQHADLPEIEDLKPLSRLYGRLEPPLRLDGGQIDQGACDGRTGDVVEENLISSEQARVNL